MSPPPRTWMSSSLELNSDTSTFSPSDTLVSETHSRPETKTCASVGRSRFSPDFITLTRLKVGWRGPRFLFLASFATPITSSQHLAKNGKEKGEVLAQEMRLWSCTPTYPYDKLTANKNTLNNLQLDQHSVKLAGVSDQQWPVQALFRLMSPWSGLVVSIHVGRSTFTHVYWCQPLQLLIHGRETERRPLAHPVHSKESFSYYEVVPQHGFSLNTCWTYISKSHYQPTVHTLDISISFVL